MRRSGLHIGHIGAVGPVHADAQPPADVADDGVAGHGVAALGKAHKHAVHAGDAHALGFAGGGLLAFLDRRRRGFGRGSRLWVEHGIEAVEHLTRRQVGVPHGSHQVVHAVKIHLLGHQGQLPFLGGLAHVNADLAAFLFQQGRGPGLRHGCVLRCADSAGCGCAPALS